MELVIRPTLGQEWARVVSKILSRMICLSSQTEMVCSTTICSSTPFGSKTYQEEDMSEDSKRLTSKLNLSAEPLLDSEDIEERVDTLLKRAGAPRDPWQL